MACARRYFTLRSWDNENWVLTRLMRRRIFPVGEMPLEGRDVYKVVIWGRHIWRQKAC